MRCFRRYSTIYQGICSRPTANLCDSLWLTGCLVRSLLRGGVDGRPVGESCGLRHGGCGRVGRYSDTDCVVVGDESAEERSPRLLGCRVRRSICGWLVTRPRLSPSCWTVDREQVPGWIRSRILAATRTRPPPGCRTGRAGRCPRFIARTENGPVLLDHRARDPEQPGDRLSLHHGRGRHLRRHSRFRGNQMTVPARFGGTTNQHKVVYRILPRYCDSRAPVRPSRLRLIRGRYSALGWMRGSAKTAIPASSAAARRAAMVSVTRRA